MGGWEGGQVGGGGGRIAEGGVYLPLDKDTNSSTVSSVSDRNKLNPQDKSRQSLVAVWYHSHSY